MADVTTEGLEVEELVVADEHEQHSEHEQHTDPALPSTGWPCQQRRKGRTAELPAPQRYLDLPIWMSAPARRREQEEEETV
ncbi:MAG: hypothetical protein ACM36B_09150 [Bacteroidota bacterium]|jgi:hypothetical protein